MDEVLKSYYTVGNSFYTCDVQIIQSYYRYFICI